jgi:hypothetical protein
MRSQPPPIDLNEFAAEAAKGTSAQRLGARYKRSARTIAAIARGHGIKIKTNSELKAEARQILSMRAYEKSGQGH